jgi:diaminopimelate decarboxylase
MDDALLTSLADRFGTPLYVYDLDAVAARVAALRRALPGAALRYAIKANPNGALLRRLAALGVGAEAITLGELERSARAGIVGGRLLLGGPRQDRPLIGRAVELGVALVSLDSAAQWESWSALPSSELGDTRFLVRINPALDPRTHEHLATGAAESKFGLPIAEATALAERVAREERLAGFHVHAGSQIGALEVYDEIFALLEPLYHRFPGARTLDIGGGFAVPDFPLERFAAALLPFVERLALSPIIEPGRYLVAEAGVLLTRVLHRKGGALQHVIADAGMAELLRPALYGADHPIRVLGRLDGPPLLADVDGPLCENADRLGRNLTLIDPRPGDLLAVERAGAYGFTMASNYASSLRPAEAVVEGGAARLARRRERPEDLWRYEAEELA